MKLAITAIAALFATQASAMDLGLGGLTAGGETVAEYNVDAEALSVTLEPEVGYSIAPLGVDLTASTLLTVYDGDFVLGDEMPTLDFEARKAIWGNMEVYGGVGFDLEAEERTDAKVGISFTF